MHFLELFSCIAYYVTSSIHSKQQQRQNRGEHVSDTELFITKDETIDKVKKTGNHH